MDWFRATGHENAGIRVSYIPDGRGHQAVSLWLSTSDDWSTVEAPTTPLQFASPGNATTTTRDLAGVGAALALAALLVEHCHQPMNLLERILINHVDKFVRTWVDL